MTRAVSNSVQMMYDNADGRRDAFMNFWSKAATAFKDQGDYVLAYELVNEPWVGDGFEHPELLVPGVADKKNLEPFYKLLNDAIRAVDDETILFYEPATGGNIQVGALCEQVPVIRRSCSLTAFLTRSEMKRREDRLGQATDSKRRAARLARLVSSQPPLFTHVCGSRSPLAASLRTLLRADSRRGRGGLRLTTAMRSRTTCIAPCCRRT